MQPHPVDDRIMGSELEFGFSGDAVASIVEHVNRVLIPPESRYRRCLLNQARFEVDGPVPEYKSPECLGPRELALHETAAVELIGSAVSTLRLEEHYKDKKFSLYKADRNCQVEKTDLTRYEERKYKETPRDFYCPPNALGSCHSNYLTYRLVDINTIKKFLITFLLTRWTCIGNVWVEIGPENKLVAVLSQRAGLIGCLENSSSNGEGRFKPLISTKDEAHADPNIWRRYHDVSGNQNMSQWQIYLKHAAMDLMFMMMETPNFLTPLPPIIDERFGSSADLSQSPSQLTKTLDFFNADIFGERTVRLANGIWWRALDFQRYFISEVLRYKKECRGPFSEEREKGLQFWIQITDAIDRKDLNFLAQYLDWAAILHYAISPILNRLGEELESFLGFSKKRIPYNTKVETGKGKVKIISYIHEIIIAYANVITEKSPYGLLLEKGLIERLFSKEVVLGATTKPPTKTRASCREELVQWAKNQTGMTIFSDFWDIIVLERDGNKMNFLFKNPYCPHTEKLGSVYSHYNPLELLANPAP